MASDPLEGFHEVNLASPTTPDLLGVCEPGTKEKTTSTNIVYRPHNCINCSSVQPNSLNVSELPTQPVYSYPRPVNCVESSGTGSANQTCSPKCKSRKDSHRAEREFLQGATVIDTLDAPDDILGLSTDSLSHLRSPSVLEVREKGYERLKEELAKAQQELKLKDEECERLSKVRDQLGQELEELTASLFEEAHKMVREANVKQATAEKQLKEAQGKIDVLQAEVAALKTLVLSTSPTSPTKEIQQGVKLPFKKGHVRNKSTSSAMVGSQQELSVMQPIVKDSKEADLSLYNEFKSWKEEPTMDRQCSFLGRIYQEDICPCLAFSKSELLSLLHPRNVYIKKLTLTASSQLHFPRLFIVVPSSQSKLASAVLEAVENNTLSIEPVGLQPTRFVKASAVECGGPKKCALSGQTKSCKHRIKLGDSSNYYYISPCCRYRITSVCNFFTYIRYIQQGLLKQQDIDQMYWEVMQLRKEMSLAKLGYYKEEL